LLAVGLAAGNLTAGDLDNLIPGIYEQFHPGLSGILIGSTNRHQAHFLTGTDAALRALNSQLGKDFAVFPFSSTAGAFKFNYDPDLGTFVKTTSSSVKSVAAISGRAAFLLPLGRMRPPIG